MTGAQLPVFAPPRASAAKMLRAMVGVGLACGAAIVGSFVGTKSTIEKNRAEALERAIFRVLPDARTRRTFLLAGGDRFEPLPAGARTTAPVVHAGYDEAGELAGFAIEARGMGYQDVITVLYGYAAGRDAIVGLQVLDSRETPGLGDKIGFDEDFLENFRALDVRLAADGRGLANPVRAVKRGEKENPWEIDGITGATISSKAVASILDGSASYWAPRIRPRLADFRAGTE